MGPADSILGENKCSISGWMGTRVNGVVVVFDAVMNDHSDEIGVALDVFGLLS